MKETGGIASLALLAAKLYPFARGRRFLHRRLAGVLPRFHLKRVRNVLFLLDIRNHIDWQISVHGSYEKQSIAFFLSLIDERRADVFIDIGSAFGLYTGHIATHCTSVREIHCFEPDPTNRAQLNSMLFLNDLADRVQVWSKALSDQAGSARFLLQRDRFERSSGNSRLAQETPFNGTAIEMDVETLTLDQALQLEGRSLALKIDVEGHELKVLKGLATLAERNNVLVQVEIFRDQLQPVRDLLRKLKFHEITRPAGIENEYYFERVK